MGIPSDLGWTSAYAAFAEQAGALPPRVGRIASEHRGGYSVVTDAGERLAQAPQSLRRRLAEVDEDKPAVGDWVGYEPVPDGSLVLRAVLPRRTRLRRKRPQSEQSQVLVTNVDRVFVVTSVGRDLSARRIERYLSIILDGGAEPVVVVAKADLADEPAREVIRAEVAEATESVRTLFVSSLTGEGLDDVRLLSGDGVTIALLGSSGVGKSSLANVLLGDDSQAIGALRDDGKGRHTTTRRELLRLPGGGVLIDTPGMRELGLIGAEAGVSEAFTDVAAFVVACRFGDCRHEREPGCAVREALERGALSEDRLESYRKLMAEVAEVAQPGASAREARRRARILSKAGRARLRDKGRR